ncbi:MAG: pantetheine-phosphate adenylyltransferase [Verrucomicrobiia bacterium]
MLAAVKRIAMYAGTFDPITYGHLDIAQRALGLFDEVILAVAASEAKHPTFTLAERVGLVEEAVQDLPESARLRVEPFSGLLVQHALSREACAVIRGLRAVSDFEFEFQLALMNRKLDEKLETIFLMPKESYTYLSSRIIKEISRLGGDISPFVPACVQRALEERKARP